MSHLFLSMAASVSIPASILALPTRTPEFGARLESWCAINSGSNSLAGLARMLAALRDHATQVFPGAAVAALELPETTAQALSVRMRPNAPLQVLLSGHYDTVFDAEDPFQTCRWLDADTLNAPGAADMKGGLVTLFAALAAFEQTPAAAAGRLGWQVLLNPDEEIGSHGVKPLFARAAHEHDFALIFEPARPNGSLVRSRMGVGGGVVTCRGRAAHAAKIPNDGRNAIVALAEFIVAASRLPEEMPGVLLTVGNIRGGGAATNVVPDFAQSEIDLRVTRMDQVEPLLARLRALAAPINARDGLRLEVEARINRLPKECGPAEETAFAAWQAHATALGLGPLDWVHTGGGSDGNLLSTYGLPNLDGLGPLGDGLHSAREFCRVSTIAPRAQLAALFLERLARGDITLPARPRG